MAYFQGLLLLVSGSVLFFVVGKKDIQKSKILPRVKIPTIHWMMIHFPCGEANLGLCSGDKLLL